MSFPTHFSTPLIDLLKPFYSSRKIASNQAEEDCKKSLQIAARIAIASIEFFILYKALNKCPQLGSWMTTKIFSAYPNVLQSSWYPWVDVGITGLSVVVISYSAALLFAFIDSQSCFFALAALCVRATFRRFPLLNSQTTLAVRILCVLGSIALLEGAQRTPFGLYTDLLDKSCERLAPRMASALGYSV